MKHFNYHYKKYSSSTMQRRLKVAKSVSVPKITTTINKVGLSAVKTTVCTLLIATTLQSCKTSTIYVPLPTTSTHFENHLQKDSISTYDSVFVAQKTLNDTLYITKEKYKYVYKDKLIHDTINLTDTISVMVPVVETKEVNKLHKWQQILMALGGVFIGLSIWKIRKL